MNNNYSNISKELSVKSEKNQSYMSKFSLQLSQNKSIIKHLNLDKFKTELCKNENCDNIKLCPYYHSNSDKRRNISEVKYLPRMCQFGKNCLKKAKCSSSHNKYEINYHPNNYRKKYCKHILDPSRCQYQIFCAKSHSPEELKLELLNFLDFDDDFSLFKYKTEFCPINWEHNYNKCVYAHSWEDFRRNIIKFPYSHIPCEQIDPEKGVCKNLGNCHFSHGWFEFEFHPLNFKKKKCDQEECERAFCPFLHPGDSDRFVEISKLKNFYIYPYNRIYPGKISNTESFFEKASENIIN